MVYMRQLQYILTNFHFELLVGIMPPKGVYLMLQAVFDLALMLRLKAILTAKSCYQCCLHSSVN